MQNTLKIGVLFIGLILILTQCTDNPTKNTEIDTPSVQDHFSKHTFSNVIPFEFEVEWNNGHNGYSKKTKSAFYEFPVKRKVKYDHDQAKDRQESFVEYKILAIPNQSSYDFYALKYISNQQYSSINQSKLGKFTGSFYKISEKGRKLSARHYENGKFLGDLTPRSEEKYQKLPDSVLRLSEECYTVTTYHWTDWYLASTGEYLGSDLESVTEEEYCESSGGGSGGPSGDGGGGSSTTYHEHTDSSMPSHFLSMNPSVKYPENSNYEEQYPKLTEYLRNKLPNIASNDRIVDAILKYTDLTREQVKEELQWGEGPTVEIAQLANFDGLDQYTIGYFDWKSPNTIFLDIDMINAMESTTPGSLMGDALIFWVGSTILYEFVHYGDEVDGDDYPGEEGRLFEDEVYGQNVTRKDATKILLRGSKKW